MATNWTTVEFQGASSRSAKGVVGTTVATLVICEEPGAIVHLQNQDGTAGNTVTYVLNDTPVSGTAGINLPGANALHTIHMVAGDVLRAIAAADREVDIVVVPYY